MLDFAVLSYGLKKRSSVSILCPSFIALISCSPLPTSSIWLSHDETAAVAEDLGVSTDEVTEMERRLTSRDAVFDPGPDESDDDRSFTPAAYLPSPNADPAQLMENEDWHDDATSRMADALADLDDRSRHILERRWLAEKKQTLTELAESGDGDVLEETLVVLRDLRDEAPSDIEDEWSTLVFALEGLVDAFEEAGTTPGEYDSTSPPEGVSDAEAQKLEAAAAELGGASGTRL